MSEKKCGQCKKVLDIKFFIDEKNKEYKLCGNCRAYTSGRLSILKTKDPEKYKEHKEKDKLAKQKRRKEFPEETAFYENKRNIKRISDDPEYFIFSSARKRAKDKKLEFNITRNDIKYLLKITNECPLRMVPFERGIGRGKHKNACSLDRIIPNEGYIRENIQIISHRANLIKNSCTIQEFNLIVNNFKNFKCNEHNIDDNIRSVIINDRYKYIIESDRYEDRWKLMSIENILMYDAKKRSKNKKLEYNINADYIKSIWPLDNKCPIINEKFTFNIGSSTSHSASLDRINNNLGYIKGNVRVISLKANIVKNDATLEELEFILENWKILENNRKRI